MFTKKIFLPIIVLFLVIFLLFATNSLAAGIKPLSNSIAVNLATTGADAETIEGFTEWFNFTLTNNGNQPIDRVNITVGISAATETNFTVNESTISDPSGWAHNVTYDAGGKILIINWSTSTDQIPVSGKSLFFFFFLTTTFFFSSNTPTPSINKSLSF